MIVKVPVLDVSNGPEMLLNDDTLVSMNIALYTARLAAAAAVVLPAPVSR